MRHWSICKLSWLLGAAIYLLAVPASTAMAGPVTLAVIGDSSSSGYGLAPQDDFVDQLAVWLKENGAPPLVIKNFAASGLTTDAALVVLERELASSVDAMVVQLGSSDNSVSIERGETRANLKKILELAKQNGTSVLLVGDIATIHQTPAYRQEFDTLFPQTAAEAGALYYPSFYQALGGRLSDVPPKYLQWDRAHPTAVAVRIIVNDIGPIVLELIEGTNAAKEAN